MKGREGIVELIRGLEYSFNVHYWPGKIQTGSSSSGRDYTNYE
jgi:hypothetical protein